MYLFLCSQDLHRLDLALVDTAHVLEQTSVETTPEQFLSVLDSQLSVWHTQLARLKGVIVVSGPGSFTSSRLTVTIANAISFALSLPMIAVENPDRLAVKELLKSIDFDTKQSEFAIPVYDRPAHIT